MCYDDDDDEAGGRLDLGAWLFVAAVAIVVLVVGGGWRLIATCLGR